MRRPFAPSTSLTAVSAATTPSSPGLNSATSELSVGGAVSRPVDSARRWSGTRPDFQLHHRTVRTNGAFDGRGSRIVRTIRVGALRLDHPQFPARFLGHALWRPDR